MTGTWKNLRRMIFGGRNKWPRTLSPIGTSSRRTSTRHGASATSRSDETPVSQTPPFELKCPICGPLSGSMIGKRQIFFLPPPPVSRDRYLTRNEGGASYCP